MSISRRSLADNTYFLKGEHASICIYVYGESNALVIIETEEKKEYLGRYLHVQEKHHKNGFKPEGFKECSSTMFSPVGMPPQWHCETIEEKSMSNLCHQLDKQAKKYSFSTPKAKANEMAAALIKEGSILDQDLVQSIQDVYKKVFGKTISLASESWKVQSNNPCLIM